MTDAQITSFYSTDIVTKGIIPFGSQLKTVCANVASKYACVNPANCTSAELVNLQWGSSGVTRNPVNVDLYYTPESDTTADWG